MKYSIVEIQEDLPEYSLCRKYGVIPSKEHYPYQSEYDLSWISALLDSCFIFRHSMEGPEYWMEIRKKLNFIK